MKIWLCQAMNGTLDDFEEERNELLCKLKKQGHEVLEENYKLVVPNGCDAGLFYLTDDIKNLSKADAVIFMNGWEKARNCRILEQCAKEYGKFIKYL